MNTFWKQDWDRTRERFVAWWRHRGLVLWVTAPRAVPLLDLPEPESPPTLEQRWLDPIYRARQAEYQLSRTYFGGEAFPFMDSNIGPGNLATFLGSEPEFAPDTVWYKPCIQDLETHPPLTFDPRNHHFQAQMAIIEEGLRVSAGRFLVSIPDLIENLDTLASLRGAQQLMYDLVERPSFVKERIAEINQVYFTVFDLLYQKVRDRWGGNVFSAFCIWGPGKTAKLQCDASAMISRRTFDEIVVPALSEQCRWLDFSLYHLDGTHAMHHLDSLLAIEELDAIEWTPQAGQPGGGDPIWYNLYRRILAAGKSVQAVGVRPEEVIPLIDAVGPHGMFIMTAAENEAAAQELEERVESYR